MDVGDRIDRFEELIRSSKDQLRLEQADTFHRDPNSKYNWESPLIAALDELHSVLILLRNEVETHAH